jgi:hypothetical protein
MNTKSFLQLLLALAVLVASGVTTYTVLDRISDRALYLAIGGGSALVAVLLIGLLFIAKDAMQAYITQRLLAEDDYRDLKQMAMVSQLMGKPGKSNVNVKLPKQDQAPWAVLPQHAQQNQPGPVFDGQFRDTTREEVELE